MNYKKKLIKVTPIFGYRGILVERIIGGYIALGKKVNTMQDVDDLIDSSHKSIERSITVENKSGSISCQNENV